MKEFEGRQTLEGTYNCQRLALQGVFRGFCGLWTVSYTSTTVGIHAVTNDVSFYTIRSGDGGRKNICAIRKFTVVTSISYTYFSLRSSPLLTI